MTSVALDSFPTVKDKTRVKPIKDSVDISKAKTKTPMVSKNLFHADFKKEARDYLKKPNRHRDSAYFSSSKAKVPRVAKNSANLATIMAVAAKPTKPRMSKPKISQPQITKPKKTSVLKEKRIAASIRRIKKKY